MKNYIRYALILLLGSAVLPAAGQESTSKKHRKDEPKLAAAARTPNPDPSASLSAAKDASYVIGPEDVLDISVWKEPDVTRVVPVRPDGMISLPLIHDVQAAGLTPTGLANLITEKLKKFLNDPQVTVIVTAINSRRVYIVGEVPRAGAFPLLPDMTVLQALSSAGGFTPYADVKNIHVVRMENGKQLKFAFNYKEVIRGEKVEQNIKLKPGDTIVVP